MDVEKNDILNAFQQLPVPFLLMGDMNVGQHFWRKEINNQKGKIFEELLVEEYLTLLKNIEPTHYHIQINSYRTKDRPRNCVLRLLYRLYL